MTQGNSRRLQLMWPDKERRLLSHGENSYEWVDPSDWRVSEVRLLHEGETVGDLSAKNLLIQGDALHALTSLTQLPEYAKDYLGKVKLVYIDPPFNTGQAFTHYKDSEEHSVWLTMLRDRLTQIKRLLSPDGSVWVHLDDTEQHRARCVMDEVFGAENFVATVMWQKVYARDNRAAISTSQDYIHVYAKSASKWKIVRNLSPRSGTQVTDYKNPDDDHRGPWKAGNFTAQAGHATPSQFYEITLPSGEVVSPPSGACWRYTEVKYQELLADDRIWFGKNGNGKPAQKMFLSEVQDGVVPTTWWTYEEVGHNQEAKKEIKSLFPAEEPFTTPKPERLMERIIRIGSNPGEIVLDCFAGSGTTAAVAHKMGRRWVTVELSPENIDTFVKPRLIQVVAGEDLGGITGAVDWEGGRGFRTATLGPSMFETYEDSIILSDWATGGELAEATAAQLRYPYEPNGPFAGTKGRSRLAVLDGMLTEGIAEFLVNQLDEDQTVLVVAHTLAPGVSEYLGELRKGSKARKIPRDLAHISVLPPRLVTLQTSTAQEDENA